MADKEEQREQLKKVVEQFLTEYTLSHEEAAPNIYTFEIRKLNDRDDAQKLGIFLMEGRYLMFHDSGLIRLPKGNKLDWQLAYLMNTLHSVVQDTNIFFMKRGQSVSITTEQIHETNHGLPTKEELNDNVMSLVRAIATTGPQIARVLKGELAEKVIAEFTSHLGI